MSFVADSESAHIESSVPAAQDFAVSVGDLSLSREQLGVTVVDTTDCMAKGIQIQARGTLHHVDLSSTESALPAAGVFENADAQGRVPLDEERIEHFIDRLTFDISQEVPGVLVQMFDSIEEFQQQLSTIMMNSRLQDVDEFKDMVTRVAVFFNRDRIFQFVRKENTETISPEEAQRLIEQIIKQTMASSGNYLVDILNRNQLWMDAVHAA